MMCLQFIPSPEPESAWANRGLIRLRGDFGFGAGFNPDHRTASQLLSQCEAARPVTARVPNFAQRIILANGIRASAQVPRHLLGAQACQWCHSTLIASGATTCHTASGNVDYCA